LFVSPVDLAANRIALIDREANYARRKRLRGSSPR
jgi:hypothetical protein